MTLQKSYDDLFSEIEHTDYLIILSDRWPRNRYEAAVKFLNIRKESRVLDIGCGNGNLLNYIQTKSDFVYGIDISPKNVTLARTKLDKKVKLSAQDINNKLNFPDNYFDIIIMTDVIEHTIDRYFVMSEIKRVLKKGGYVFIGTPNISKLKNRLIFLLGGYPYSSEQDNSSRKTEIIYDGGHLQWFTFKTLKQLAQRFNFKIVKTFGYGRFGKFHNLFPSLFSGAIGIILKK